MTDDEKRDFGRRLQQLLDQNGMNYSDLARLMWGKTMTRQGYEVAKNRDRISVWVRGSAAPSPHSMQLLATTLGVQIADLAPNYGIESNTSPEWSLTKVQGQDKVLLRVNQMMTAHVAAQIVALLTGTSA